MRNLIITLTLLCFNYAVNAQEYYWTTYSFNVEAEDVTTVVSLTDDYFSQPGSKAEGVIVYLFENHFRDSDNDWSHQFAFTGSLDAMGEQYSRGENDSWELFLTKLSQFTKSHSAAAGNSLITIGEAGTHPIQNILWLSSNIAFISCIELQSSCKKETHTLEPPMIISNLRIQP